MHDQKNENDRFPLDDGTLEQVTSLIKALMLPAPNKTATDEASVSVVLNDFFQELKYAEKELNALNNILPNKSWFRFRFRFRFIETDSSQNCLFQLKNKD